MNPTAEDESSRRAFQPRHGALSTPSFHGQFDQNGDSSNDPPQQNRRATYGGDQHQPQHAGLAIAGREFSRESSAESLEGGGGAEDDEEFESFHRSFRMGTNPLDSMAARSGYGNNSPDPMNALTGASPAPASSTMMGQQQQYQPQESHEIIEDPTVVQARRSMMARTGDRHARGKLPEPKEGRFMRPDSSPTEPQIPAPRSSKRYVRHRVRVPDLLEGTAQTENGSSLKDDEHVVTCGGCNRALIVKKSAVIVRCVACSKVSSASSGNSVVRSQVASR